MTVTNPAILIAGRADYQVVHMGRLTAFQYSDPDGQLDRSDGPAQVLVHSDTGALVRADWFQAGRLRKSVYPTGRVVLYDVAGPGCDVHIDPDGTRREYDAHARLVPAPAASERRAAAVPA